MCSASDDPTTYGTEAETMSRYDLTEPSEVAIARKADEYNGWTNRETWNTHLWMTNDPADYEMAREIVRGRYESDMDYPEVGAADALKEWWDELYAPQGIAASPLVDAWSYAIDRTDWRRIVEAFTEGETWAADRAARLASVAPMPRDDRPGGIDYPGWFDPMTGRDKDR